MDRFQHRDDPAPRQPDIDGIYNLNEVQIPFGDWGGIGNHTIRVTVADRAIAGLEIEVAKYEDKRWQARFEPMVPGSWLHSQLLREVERRLPDAIDWVKRRKGHCSAPSFEADVRVAEKALGVA